MVELARAYAALIDQDEGLLDKLGRPFQRTLRELGLTPKSRAALPEVETDSRSPSPLDAIRANRERRLAGFTAAPAVADSQSHASRWRRWATCYGQSIGSLPTPERYQR